MSHSKFLNFTPWSNYSFFRSYVLIRSLIDDFAYRFSGSSHCHSSHEIQRLSKSCRSFWRAFSLDEKRICEILMASVSSNCPQKRFVDNFQRVHAADSIWQVTVEMLEFSPLERKIYDSLYTSAKKKFDRLSEQGLIGKSYTHILAMLMR